MPSANLNRRDTLERAYPRAAFAEDAARNAQPTNEVVFGVRVVSAPDQAGAFVLERASRHIGEAPSPTFFLAPQRRRERLTNAAGDAPPAAPIAPAPRDEYDEFLGDIVTAAHRFGYDATTSPGRDDPRLKGPRQ